MDARKSVNNAGRMPYRRTVSASAEAGKSLKQAYDAAMAALQPRYGTWVIFDVSFDPWWRSWPCPGYDYGYPCDDGYYDY